MYTPEHLKLWARPDHYAGNVWPGYYSSGIGRSRDSDVLEESNFECMLKALGGESETVLIVREGHWAVGWVEWIAIHQDDYEALKTADGIKGGLEICPIVDEDHFSELEWTRAADYWDTLSPRDKVREALWARERFHWLTKTPVWRFGRMSFCDVTNDGSEIANYLYETMIHS